MSAPRTDGGLEENQILGPDPFLQKQARQPGRDRNGRSIRNAADIFPAIAAIFEAAARGELNSSEALELSRRVEKRARPTKIGAERRR